MFCTCFDHSPKNIRRSCRGNGSGCRISELKKLNIAEFAPMLRVLGSYPSYKPAPADTQAAQKFESLA